MHQPLSAADKLLAVCRAVWPHHTWHIHDDNTVRGRNRRLDPVCAPQRVGSLDDLRRVLLALSGEQRSKFDCAFEVVKPLNGAQVYTTYPQASEILTAPTTQILDALHRAVCPE